MRAAILIVTLVEAVLMAWPADTAAFKISALKSRSRGKIGSRSAHSPAGPEFNAAAQPRPPLPLQHPYLALLVMRKNANVWAALGALVSPRHVLAASSDVNWDWNDMEVFAGLVNATNHFLVKTGNVKSMVHHPQARLSIIQLNVSIAIPGTNIAPIRLPPWRDMKLDLQALPVTVPKLWTRKELDVFGLQVTQATILSSREIGTPFLNSHYYREDVLLVKFNGLGNSTCTFSLGENRDLNNSTASTSTNCEGVESASFERKCGAFTGCYTSCQLDTPTFNIPSTIRRTGDSGWLLGGPLLLQEGDGTHTLIGMLSSETLCRAHGVIAFVRTSAYSSWVSDNSNLQVD